jgi:hypothetical protein
MAATALLSLEGASLFFQPSFQFGAVHRLNINKYVYEVNKKININVYVSYAVRPSISNIGSGPLRPNKLRPGFFNLTTKVLRGPLSLLEA